MRDQDIYVIPSDREEMMLFLALAENPNNDDAREAYRAWLAARQDPRAEAFVIEAQLLASPPPPNAQALREKIAQLFTTPHQRKWWRLLSRTTSIRQCGLAIDPSPRVRFNYACPERWETLDPTADPTVRHCSSCGHEVYFCGSVEEVAERARRGECVTVESRLVVLAQRNLGRMMTGRPDYDDLWAREILNSPDPEE